MASGVTQAVVTLESLFGHHTAHLTKLEQIQAAMNLAKSLSDTAADLADDIAEDLAITRGALEEIGRMPTLEKAQSIAHDAYVLT